MSRLRALTILPALLSLLLAAGCGSSKSSTSSASTSTSAQSTPAAAPVRITTKHDKLGTILAAGPKRLTVYLFEADSAGRSSCAGACVHAWPPVIGKPVAAGAVQAADLGTITRPDGSVQATYKGHPLYYFIKDKDDGDAYGQAVTAFGAKWFVLNPSGVAVHSSGAAPASGGTSTTSSATSAGSGTGSGAVSQTATAPASSSGGGSSSNMGGGGSNSGGGYGGY